MSIHIKETTLSHPALMPFNIYRRTDPILATCQTLILINPLVLADPRIIDGDREARFVDTGVVRLALSPFSKGVLQITHLLDQCPHIQALHIYTTGNPGRLDLGQDILTSETMERYAWELQSWFSCLPSYINPTLTLGHCHVGDGPKGIAFIDQLRHLTGCHIRCLCSSTGHHLQLV
ncbi:MAG: DUF4347 domain-containing protein [Cyanothece sp. SIO2G6]|nr:DUF4347 domain-containing protein [Cyanothece sp. SIO2G6]